MIYNNILETIGNTPVVKLNRMAPDHVEMYVKVESFNPLASVKDRLAFAIINDAEQKRHAQARTDRCRGDVRQYRHRAWPWCVRPRDHPFVATMADSFSVERRKIMRGLGAKVILTPAAERGTGMVRKRPRNSRRSTAGSWRGSSRIRPIRNTTRTPPGPEILQRFRREAPRLLGHRLRYGRHDVGRGAHDQGSPAGREDRCDRA